MFLSCLSRSAIRHLTIGASITSIHLISNPYNLPNICVGIISGNMIASGVKNIINGKKKYGIYQILTASSLIISNIALSYLLFLHQQNMEAEKNALKILNDDNENINFPWGIIPFKDIKDQIKNISCIATDKADLCDVYLTPTGNQTLNQYKINQSLNDFSARFLQEKIFDNCGYVLSTMIENLKTLRICVK